MPPPRKVDLLPPELRQWLQEALRFRGFADYEALADELNWKLEETGSELRIRKSAIHEFGSEYREFVRLQEQASGWAKEWLVAQVTALHQSQTTIPALQSSLTQIGVALGVAQDARPEAVVAAAQAAGKTGTDLVPALQSQVTTLETALQAIQTERARDRAVTFIDGAKASGCTSINQTNRDEFIAMHMANPATTEKLINGFPKIAPGELPQPQTVALQSDSRDLVARARQYLAAQHAAGHDIGWGQAVRAVSEGAK